MRAYIQFKESWRPKPSSTIYVADVITEEKMIDFFGLREPDIEWYTINIEIRK